MSAFVKIFSLGSLSEFAPDRLEMFSFLMVAAIILRGKRERVPIVQVILVQRRTLSRKPDTLFARWPTVFHVDDDPSSALALFCCYFNAITRNGSRCRRPSQPVVPYSLEQLPVTRMCSYR